MSRVRLSASSFLLAASITIQNSKAQVIFVCAKSILDVMMIGRPHALIWYFRYPNSKSSFTVEKQDFFFVFYNKMALVRKFFRKNRSNGHGWFESLMAEYFWLMWKFLWIYFFSNESSENSITFINCSLSFIYLMIFFILFRSLYHLSLDHLLISDLLFCQSPLSCT